MRKAFKIFKNVTKIKMKTKITKKKAQIFIKTIILY